MTLEKIGLKPASLPFDWLLNLEGGLDAVNAIVESDFATVTGEDAYVLRPLATFPEDMVAYRHHPGIIHLHSDPLRDPRAAAALERRIARFREVLGADEMLHFVAYEAIWADPPPEDAVIAGRLAELIRQGERFLAFADRRRGRADRHRLLLVLQTHASARERTRAMIARMPLPDARLTLDHTILRNDRDRRGRATWRRQWIWTLMTHTGMPLRPRIRSLRSLLSSLLREVTTRP
jgi:hypothetical protein